MVTLQLPYPPSINHHYSYVRGRPVLSKEARSYRRRVRSLLAHQKVEPLTGPLAVRIEMYPPDKRRRDCDNVQKAVLDALQQGGLFWDDSQVVWLLTEKKERRRGGAIYLTCQSFDQSNQIANEGDIE